MPNPLLTSKSLAEDGELNSKTPKLGETKIHHERDIEETRKRAKSGCSINLKNSGSAKNNGGSESSEEVDEDDDFFEIANS